MLKRARIMGYKSLWDAEITFTDPLTLHQSLKNHPAKQFIEDARQTLQRLRPHAVQSPP